MPQNNFLSLKIALIISLNLVSFQTSLASSTREPLRKQIFTKELNENSCHSLKITPSGKTPVDAELSSFIESIVKSINSNSPKDLTPLFHKRLKVGFGEIQQQFKHINTTYHNPVKISGYRLWAINSVKPASEGLNCANNELKLYPLYGYPLQFSLWFQIMGQKELGRLHITLVPTKGRWNIGSFHLQQWTHEGKDFATWAEEGEKNLHMDAKSAAFVKLDLAQKLLNGGGYLKINLRDEVIAMRNKASDPKEWESTISSALVGWNTAYVSSMLVEGGAGILVRISISKEITSDQMVQECQKISAALKSKNLHHHLMGVRCNFLLPKEDPKKDGLLGGLFVAFNNETSAEK